MRIALLTLESPLSDPAVLDLLDSPRGRDVVLIGRSASAATRGLGALATGWRRLRQSGPRLLPFLAVNYALPGRGRIAARAAAAGIAAPALADMNGPAAWAALRAARPDVVVTLHCDQILAAPTLALAPLGGVNLHPSLLPAHRGPVPTIWALAEGEPRFGVSVHRLTSRIDAGPVLAQRAVALPAGLSASAASRALHRAGVPVLDQALAVLARGAATAQTAPPLPYCPFPPPALLRHLARSGRRLVDRQDIAAALWRGTEPGGAAT
jgi:folate-dependent phosphoribosylglycinamide formyltransferase PurN